MRLQYPMHALDDAIGLLRLLEAIRILGMEKETTPFSGLSKLTPTWLWAARL